MAHVAKSLLDGNRYYLLAEARSELMMQEYKVKSLNTCIGQRQQQTHAQRLELEDAHHGYVESRREHVRLQEEVAMKGKAIRDTQIRSMHEMGEIKRAQELRVDEFSVQNWEKVMIRYRSSLFIYKSCKRGWIARMILENFKMWNRTTVEQILTSPVNEQSLQVLNLCWAATDACHLKRAFCLKHYFRFVIDTLSRNSSHLESKCYRRKPNASKHRKLVARSEERNRETIPTPRFVRRPSTRILSFQQKEHIHRITWLINMECISRNVNLTNSGCEDCVCSEQDHPEFLLQEKGQSRKQKAQKEDRFLRERQIAYMIYKNFRVTGAHDTVLDYADLFTITLRNDNIQEFDTRWSEILLSMTRIPPDDVLESLYTLRIRESDELKTVLELNDMEIHRMISKPDHQQLKNRGEEEYRSETSITKLGRQAWGNWIRSSDKESKGINRRWRRKRYLLPVQRKSPVFATITVAVCGMRVTIVQNRHPKTAPPSEVEVCRDKRNARGRSQSEKFCPQPCTYFLKGTCNESPSDFWHPPECQFYNTKSGCKFGAECSFLQWKVEERPNKKAEKRVMTKVQ